MSSLKYFQILYKGLKGCSQKNIINWLYLNFLSKFFLAILFKLKNKELVQNKAGFLLPPFLSPLSIKYVFLYPLSILLFSFPLFILIVPFPPCSSLQLRFPYPSFSLLHHYLSLSLLHHYLSLSLLHHYLSLFTSPS